VPHASGNGGRSPLVGRMRERVVLVGKLHELLRGRSATVVVEGEAGLGKSRLADDLLDQAEAMGVPRLIGAREAARRGGAVPRVDAGVSPDLRARRGRLRGGARPVACTCWLVPQHLVPEAVPRAPLLASALALDEADSERTAG
jgi:hypothetical protein